VWEECQNKALRREFLRISQNLNGLLGNQERDGCTKLKTICRKLVLEGGEKWREIVTPGINPEEGQGPAWTIEPVEERRWRELKFGNKAMTYYGKSSEHDTRVISSWRTFCLLDVCWKMANP
jgi:hypothetical protein